MAVRVPRVLFERDPAVVAPLAGLVPIHHSEPGWTRRRCGRGFTYIDERGDIVRPPKRDRLEQLATPPAWQDVWFAPTERAYLQATGIDDAERRQYRYHDRYRAFRERTKFDRMRYFARALPELRRYIDRALQAPENSQERAIGGVLATLDKALVRIGNDTSAAHGSHGATSLTAEHLFEGELVELEYTAKGGKLRSVLIEDEDLTDLLHDLVDSPTDRLFGYLDDGEARSVSAAQVNRTIATIAGPAFTAKDFRTWGGSRTALEARVEGATRIEAVDAAAQALGNTRAVARSSYVHPRVESAPAEQIEQVWRSSRRSSLMSRGDSALRKLVAEPLVDLATFD